MPDCASANVRTVATVYVPVPLSEGAAGLVVVLLFTRRLPALVGGMVSNMTVTRSGRGDARGSSCRSARTGSSASVVVDRVWFDVPVSGVSVDVTFGGDP